MMNLFRKKTKPERPFLKLCEACHGKGQLSYHDIAQRKKYGPCDKCCKGDEVGAYSLGVKLKCTCQEESASYEWVHALQSKHLPQSLPEIQALQQLQAELGHTGQALLLLCDCGGKYLCIDSQERKKISGSVAANEADKTHNKILAEALVEKGIHQTVEEGDDGYL